VIAHVGGLPVEEVLPALLSGGGAWLILQLASLRARTVGNEKRTVNGRRRKGRNGDGWIEEPRDVSERGR
jgi:hypothetical protein